MKHNNRNSVAFGSAISLLFVAVFVLWSELDPESLRRIAKEDGPIESLSAVFFGLSSILFIVFARRSEFLREKRKIGYFFTISWAILMFVFMGEEISWGQRIFGIATPDALREINLQNETTVHNIEFLNTYFGGTHRYLSIMMLTTGLLLPAFALSNYGRQIIQRFAFPVSPFRYAPLFVGGYLYGKYYVPTIPQGASEIREFLMAVGMLSFAMHGAAMPCSLFRACESKTYKPEH